jgi:nitric oxide reductase FlRd-NAD(+) reductase
MNSDIIVIGSGFAAYQLIKNLRRQNADIAISMICDDSGDEYNKPDLSHVFSQNQSADDLTKTTAAQFAERYRVSIHPYTVVSAIDRTKRTLSCGEMTFSYRKLVIATGAKAIIPDIEGSSLLMTLNGQQEYRKVERRLKRAKSVVILGGGLIGVELAMDLCRAGKEIAIIDRAHSILASLMPPELSARLQHHLSQMGIRLYLSNQAQALKTSGDGVLTELADGHQIYADAALASIGLKPNVALAHTAGLDIGRGITVNQYLQTSDPNIYALGDCAEIQGRLMPFLQPILLSAVTAAHHLLGEAKALNLPAMLVKIKTPELPLHLAGDAANPDLNWQIGYDRDGMIAKGWNAQRQLAAFAVSENHLQQAFKLLRELPNSN